MLDAAETGQHPHTWDEWMEGMMDRWSDRRKEERMIDGWKEKGKKEGRREGVRV